MTTKELESKLKISENTCIHCSTLELAKQVLSIFRKLGLKWCDEINYIKHTYWDIHKNITIYYPFDVDEDFSYLEFAQSTGYKIISAEKFIDLHTEEFNLENYKPKGALVGFPKEIIARILDCQEKQGNPRDVSVFEKHKSSTKAEGGFDWDKTKEKWWFWAEVINIKNFNAFFEKYPKKEDNSQEFNLENYTPKGDLIGFPKEIIARMLDCQEEQGTKRDVNVFEKYKDSSLVEGGFDWEETKEKDIFWYNVICNKDFDLFFEEYPKQDNQYNSQEFNLENYVPKGELEGFPKEIIARMLECQVEQGYKNNILVFEKSRSSGFSWNKTKEGCNFWFNVIKGKNFNLFFKRYPKKEDNSQEFKVGDKVIDIISGQIGKVTKIDTLNNDSYSILVDFNNNEIVRFTLDGRYYGIDKYPRLLHYRDDYDYSVIDFNNLPKRQEQKMWRAKEEGVYHFVNFLTKGWFFSDESSDDYDCPIDNNNYNSGNYFRTEVEAEIIAQKLNTYFKQLIKEEHDN